MGDLDNLRGVAVDFVAQAHQTRHITIDATAIWIPLEDHLLNWEATKKIRMAYGPVSHAPYVTLRNRYWSTSLGIPLWTAKIMWQHCHPIPQLQSAKGTALARMGTLEETRERKEKRRERSGEREESGDKRAESRERRAQNTEHRAQNTVQHSKVQYITAKYSTVQHSAAQCSTVQHSTTQHNTDHLFRAVQGGGSFLLFPSLAIVITWTRWGLNPGPSACEADVIPLHHTPVGAA